MIAYTYLYELLVFKTACYVASLSPQYGLYVMVEGDSLQILKMTINMLHKQSWTANKE